MNKSAICLYLVLISSAFAGGAAADPTSDQKQAAPVTLTGSDADKAIKRADDFLSSATTMIGDFVQSNTSDGRQSEGKIYVQKPGKMRFEYAAPATLEVVADGSTVMVTDRKLKTHDPYSIGNTPLKFLLRDKIDLKADTQILNVQKIGSPERVMILLDDRATWGGTSRIRLIFDASTYELLQWQVRDPQGFETLVTLYNVDLKQKPDPKLFKISTDAAQK